MGFILLIIIIGLGIYFIKKYNSLQTMNQNIKQARSNIYVLVKQKIAIINKFSEVVSKYCDYEQVTHLTASENYTEMARDTASAINSIQALANMYPNLKADGQYAVFLDNISQNERELTQRREIYNAQVNFYNSEIAQIPMVFVASALGFKEAPYFDAENENAIDSFSGANPEAIKELALKGTEQLKDKLKKIKEDNQKKNEDK